MRRDGRQRQLGARVTEGEAISGQAEGEGTTRQSHCEHEADGALFEAGLPRPALRIGVTGHRQLSPEAAKRLAPQVDAVLTTLAQALGEIVRGSRFSDPESPAAISVLSQLAAGADQIVALRARARGHAIHAVLPFPRVQFTADFADPDDRARFDELADAAEVLWHLPGSRDDEGTAYALAGEATVAQSDLVIAIWDGAAARGRGGTGQVVSYAIRRGVPIVHISADDSHPPRILWAGLEGIGPTLLHSQNVPLAPAEPAELTRLVDRILAPPPDPAERRNLRVFGTEPVGRIKPRLEFPLLLWATGVRPMRRNDVLLPPPPVTSSPIAVVYARADRQADRYAQLYRSGGLFNFAAAAGSVLVALGGLLVPDAKAVVVVVELVIIALLIANTSVGNRRQWHRRWLDYRYLAEQLRIMRSLKTLSVAKLGAHTAPLGQQRWMDHVAKALWRQSPPRSITDLAELHRLIDDRLAPELADQIAYHHGNAARMHQLDHRLHLAGTWLFAATIVAGLTSLVAIGFGIEALTDQSKWFTVLSAGLPTVGAALFGIRGQGDFAGAAGRSRRTAERLEGCLARLRAVPASLDRTARVMEDAADAMLADLGEWRTAYSNRKLNIPS